jgi:hypothetical protein
MKWVTPRANLHHLDPYGFHLLDGVQAKSTADAPTSKGWRNCQQVEFAVVGSFASPPRDESGDRAHILSHCNMTTTLRVVQGREIVTVVLLPLTVLVLKYIVAKEGADVPFEEGSERLNGYFDEAGNVRRREGPDTHGVAFRSEGYVRDYVLHPSIDGTPQRIRQAMKHSIRQIISGLARSSPYSHWARSNSGSTFPIPRGTQWPSALRGSMIAARLDGVLDNGRQPRKHDQRRGLRRTSLGRPQHDLLRRQRDLRLRSLA